MTAAVKLLLVLMVLSVGRLQQSCAQSSEMNADRAHRDISIHWTAGYEPSVAPVLSHNELEIHADCHEAFTQLADAPHWPSWLVIVKDVESETPNTTGQGALYRLRIFNSPIQSRIVEFVADQRISWSPFGTDETETHHGHYHAWHFVPRSGNCLVITEETGIGPDRGGTIAEAIAEGRSRRDETGPVVNKTFRAWRQRSGLTAECEISLSVAWERLRDRWLSQS